MQTRSKLFFLELTASLFGWFWLLGLVAAVVLALAAFAGKVSWWLFLAVLLVSIVCKWLVRSFMDLQNQVTDGGELAKYTPESGRVPEDEAQEVVNAVAKLLAERRDFFLNSNRLPRQRSEVELAFDLLLGHYEELRALSPEGFERRGYGEAVNQIKIIRTYLDSFKDIDEADLTEVEKANAYWREKNTGSQISEADSAEFFREFGKLITKYGAA